MHITLSPYYALMAAVLVLLLGRWLVRRVALLRNFNIPEPVAGGLAVALLVYVLHETVQLSLSFEGNLQSAFMLIFFSSIGLSANFSRLRQGGLALVVFLGVIATFIVVQNLVGVSLASLLGLDPLIGLVAGSVTLVGGHGTAGAWGEVFETKYGVVGATTLGIACATFGLVIGGLLGGPLAKHLISRHHLAQAAGQRPAESASGPAVAIEAMQQRRQHSVRLITADVAITTLALFAACLAVSEYLSVLMQGSAIQLPTFVWALATGVVLRNGLDYIFNYEVFDRAIDVFGDVGLSMYLALALLSLRLWELTDLAAPLMVILLAQTVTMGLYAAAVTFRLMGKNYDAAVLAAGHCGFGMGATPTAVANMQAITSQYGPSHKASLIVPLVGAFFIDIINAFMIQGFISWLR